MPHHGDSSSLSAEELAAMSPEQQMIAGAEADGVRIVHRRNRFPIPGTKAEKRAERGVSMFFLLAALAGVGFIVAFIVVPYHWQLPGESQNFRFYTPVLGGLLGLMLVLMGFGAVLWAKWLMPEEEAEQDRHDEPSTDEDKAFIQSTLAVGLQDAGVPRRSMLLRSLGLAGGALLTVPLVALVGAMIKKPGKQLDHTPYGILLPNYPNGVPIIYSTGIRVSADDLEPGGLATVFPVGYVSDASAPTLLIRLRPGQVVKARKGQAGFQFGDYVAFSKICTHAGCPASLYEQQTSRLLCPCHQSQFEVLEDAKPVFGPATRSLPKLPLGVEVVDGVQYFVAKSDFHEPIGPGFWERS
ncbi:MAG TPA: Rieske 2Fe-2S domain-containing protein [Jatrophihabitantaceae bacterium]|nr:Rieske 2Fe-2S domain-containing protein [Jatrophihabitantaceae bacterium]